MLTLLFLLQTAVADETASSEPASLVERQTLSKRMVIETGAGVMDIYYPGARIGLVIPAYTFVTNKVRKRTGRRRHGVFSFEIVPNIRTFVEPRNAVDTFVGVDIATRWTWDEGVFLGFNLGTNALFDSPAGQVFSVDDDGVVSKAPLATRVHYAPSALAEFGVDFSHRTSADFRMSVRGGPFLFLPWNTGVRYDWTLELVFGIPLNLSKKAVSQ